MARAKKTATAGSAWSKEYDADTDRPVGAVYIKNLSTSAGAMEVFTVGGIGCTSDAAPIASGDPGSTTATITLEAGDAIPVGGRGDSGLSGSLRQIWVRRTGSSDATFTFGPMAS